MRVLDDPVVPEGPDPIRPPTPQRTVATAGRPRLRDTWVLRRRDFGVLLAIYAVFTGIWYAGGWLLTGPLADSALVRDDQRVSEWFLGRRTPTLNTLSFVGSQLSDTFVKIIVTAVVAIAVLAIWRRWLDFLMVVVPLALEALTFLSVTTLVGRPRPDVPHLETSPINSSYPSGHVAASMVYWGIVVVVFWRTRRTWIRLLAVALGLMVPLCVGLSRLYRGMHFLTDVTAGALLGTASVTAVFIVLRGAQARHQPRHRPGAPVRQDQAADDRGVTGPAVEPAAPAVEPAAPAVEPAAPAGAVTPAGAVVRTDIAPPERPGLVG